MIPAVDFEFVIGSALCAHFNSHFVTGFPCAWLVLRRHCSQSSS